MQGGIEKDGKLLVIKGAKQEEAKIKVKKWLIEQSINIQKDGNNK